jgi:DUF1009 family protein
MDSRLAYTPAHRPTPVGIIAGSGDLPIKLVNACRQQGREVFIVAFEEQTDPDTVDNVPHIWIKLGALGKAFDALRTAGVQEIVMAGKINRPKLSSLQPDMVSARLLKHIGTKLFTGDNSLLTSIIAFLETEGFQVIGVEDVMREVLAPEGPLGKVMPNKQAQRDIEIGVKVAHAIGAYDVGQAVIVKNGQILGVEAAEGTDGLIFRCAALAGDGLGGVLVKAKKPYQDSRVDLPAIGIKTIENVHQAGFEGIAIEAGGSVVIDKKAVVNKADALGIFLVGFTRTDFTE